MLHCIIIVINFQKSIFNRELQVQESKMQYCTVVFLVEYLLILYVYSTTYNRYSTVELLLYCSLQSTVDDV